MAIAKYIDLGIMLKSEKANVFFKVNESVSIQWVRGGGATNEVFLFFCRNCFNFTLSVNFYTHCDLRGFVARQICREFTHFYTLFNLSCQSSK